MSQIDQLKSDIDELVPGMVALRRDLHEHPELAFEEVRTSGIVAQRLRSLGLEVQTGVAKTGVVGLLRGGASKEGAKTIAIRADMDALPIHELNEIDYRSTIDGKMHACGHDGHTSILLSVADILSKRREELAGSVKFIFQPAEEVIGGAEPMVKEGAMQGVDGVIGLHLISNYPIGRVGVRAGTVFASADRFVLNVQGFDGCLPCVNDASMTELVHEAAAASVGEGNVDSSEEVMTTGSDDMAYFLKAAPGCYFIVGARNEEKGASYPHHHPRFNVDEDSMPIAVEVLTRAAMDFLK